VPQLRSRLLGQEVVEPPAGEVARYTELRYSSAGGRGTSLACGCLKKRGQAPIADVMNAPGQDFIHRLRMIGGSDSWRKGALAGQWTAEELSRREDWELFHGLKMGPGDIDHVAVSKDGVFVFETKFTNHAWRLQGEALWGAVGDHLASVARRAWRVAGHLRRTGVSEVTPVLVVWGTQPDGSPPIQPAGNVTVVWARNPDWVFLIEGVPIAAETVSKAVSELRSFQEGQPGADGPKQVGMASGG